MTILEGRPAHLERADRIVLLYEKLLILRLAHLARTLSAAAAERPERARFVERWSSLERMNPAGLHRASRDPHLAAWVVTGEELIRNGIYQRYPDAHPKRHLDAFGRLLLSWAAQLPDGSHGQVDLAGQPAVDLMFGDAVLLGPTSDAHRTASWRTSGGVLRIGWSEADRIAEASLSDPTDIHVAHGDWRCVSKPRAGSISIDVWTWPRLDNDRPPVDARTLQDVVSQAIAAVDDGLRPLLESTCRSVTAGDAGGRWVAGLVSLSGAATLGPRELVDLACFDLVNRYVYVGCASGAIDPPRPVLVELARRMAARLRAEDPEAGFDPEARDRWGALLSSLRDTTAGLNLFSELDDVGIAVQPSSVTASAPVTVSDLLLPIGDVGVPEVPQPLRLKKTRRKAASNVNDFTPLNALSYIPESAVRAVLDQAFVAADASEGAAYLAAAAAYVVGEFEICVRSLAQCIRFDPDVEEYWHLLAFALRFLNRYKEFTEIMFGGVRSTDILERLEPLLGRTS